jgi:integrase
MGVKVRWHKGTWYVFIDHFGQQKAKRAGSREAAESVRRKIEAQLALGDSRVLEGQSQPQLPSFRRYTEKWMKRYAEVECKHSAVYGYKLLGQTSSAPEFGDVELGGVSREAVKDFAARLAARGLSRNSVRRVIGLLAEILNAALDDGLIERNPAVRILRSRKDKESKFQPVPGEQMKLLKAARTESLDRYALFLLALRAGLRRGEVVALQWGDLQFGADDATVARYIEVRRNYVYGRFTTPKGHKSRRVDMPSELRATLLELRDARLLKAFAAGESSITKAFVFSCATGGVLDLTI